MLRIGFTHGWTIGNRSVSASDPFGNDYYSKKYLEAYVAAFRILVEFSKHVLVERYHEFTQEAALGVSTITGKDDNKRVSTMC